MSSSLSTLEPYGWSASLAQHLSPGMDPARVIRHDGHTLLGQTPDGRRALRSTPRLDPQPTVGDWVAVAPPPEPTAAHPIRAVLPRRSLLRRQSADEQGEQALAANVDLVLITCGLDRPLRAGRVQRVAAQAWDCGATPVLVLTKATDPDTVDLPRLELEHPGMQVLACAALEGTGLEAVRDLVSGRTAVLVGESGAGKSTLANALLARTVAGTGAVRAGDAKGRHTTTARSLHLMPGPRGGALIDTPGVRSFGLTADLGSIDAVFPEIAELAPLCRFADCTHRSEPGCAVLDALAQGALEAARYDGWVRLERGLAGARLRANPHEFRAEMRRFSRMQRQARPRMR